LDDFWTNYNIRKRSFSGSLSGQWKCPEFVQLVFWTNSGRCSDKLQCPETLIFWITFRTMEMSGICTVSFLDKFRTNSGHSFFIGMHFVSGGDLHNYLQNSFVGIT